MFRYEGNKLVIDKPTCGCDYHKMPDTNIYIGEGIISDAAEYINEHIAGRKCMLVTDDRLFELFGRNVIKSISSSYDVRVCIPPSEGELKPDNAALGHIMMEFTPGTDFMIALGSGTVNDLVRYSASLLGIPFVSIGTAPSMDGYVSVISPLLKGNLKINVPADYPLLGIYDLDILKTASPEMMFAGFGDVIGKYIAKADWLLGSYVTGEHVCPYCLELSDEAIGLVTGNVDEISRGTVKGAKVLLEALLLTGLAMLINTNSRPAASNEHNMGHFWEMKKLMAHETHPSHGEAVGVATLYCLAFYEAMLGMDTDSVDVGNLPEGNFNARKREKTLLGAYGDRVGRSIIDDNAEEPIGSDERIRRVSNFIGRIDEIRKTMEFLPDFREIAGIYKKLGGPVRAAEIGIDMGLLEEALLYAKDYRSRYNIFKTADEMGVLEETVGKVLSML